MSSDKHHLEEERRQKITQFEAFVNEKLKVDLQKSLLERDKIYSEISAYLEVRNTIVLLKESKQTRMKTLVNLGNDFFVQATVPDTEKIFVNLGLGFYVECTLDEALEKIEAIEKFYNQKAENLTNQVVSIKGRIKLMLHGIDQLMALD
eukprot:TRINITY_DN4261_c0_g2_i1.p1 TRINITY_DN4261_c0_g2~~TRINITY_DN4261_c0_g2_i1.p1  ORF type:complete len:149 (+),score=30.00 TRINITY_DN4261_c0_g2_i1:117-563(+)